MITVNGQEYSFGDPLVLIALAGFLVALLLVFVLFALRANSKAARLSEPLVYQMGDIGQRVGDLAAGQERLAGGLKHVSEAQAASQAETLKLMEARLERVQGVMSENLQGNARRTAHSLGELQERLKTIDEAQSNITKLSSDVLSLQDILSNKQTRGSFGEIQLQDIVSKALPPDSFTWQATLSNNRRADCLIHLPNPPGPIVIDSKFPLEAYEALRKAGSDEDRKLAERAFRTSVRKHITDISQKYLIEGETADGALMFLPSEAVYAELHANYSDVVREGFAARVWIVSPTTCMATLNTMRAILKDARMREQAGAIRKELGMLSKDVERLGARVGNLDRHFSQAAKDVEEIKISATKAETRARKLDRFEFDEVETETKVTPLVPPAGE